MEIQFYGRLNSLCVDEYYDELIKSYFRFNFESNYSSAFYSLCSLLKQFGITEACDYHVLIHTDGLTVYFL